MLNRNEISYTHVLDKLANELAEGRCVLFLGRHARAEANVPTPWELSKILVRAGKLVNPAPSPALKWRQEIEENCEHCVVERRERLFEILGIPSFTPEQVAQLYEAKEGREKLLGLVRKQLDRGELSDLYLLLGGLPFSAIYTTSYDRLVETSQDGTDNILVINSDKDFVKVHRQIKPGQIPYYKLHGSINADDVIITAEDQINLELNTHNSKLFEELRRDIGIKTFLFVGYDLSDTDLLQVVISAHPKLYPHDPLYPSYAVVNHPDRFLEAYWHHKFNIETVDEDPDMFFKKLKDKYEEVMWKRTNHEFDKPLEVRHREIYHEAMHIFDTDDFCGLALYGEDPESVDPGHRTDRAPNGASVSQELDGIPKEISELVQRLSNRGIVFANINIEDLGAGLRDQMRFAKLLRELARQIDGQTTAIHGREMRLSEYIDQKKDVSWRMEAKKMAIDYCIDERGGKKEEIERILEGTHPDPDVRREYRTVYEDALAGIVSQHFFPGVQERVRSRRLVVLMSNFQLIEADSLFFDAVTQHLLKPLADQARAGLIITRKAKEPLVPPSRAFSERYSGYKLERIKQINVREV